MYSKISGLYYTTIWANFMIIYINCTVAGLQNFSIICKMILCCMMNCIMKFSSEVVMVTWVVNLKNRLQNNMACSLSPWVMASCFADLKC